MLWAYAPPASRSEQRFLFSNNSSKSPRAEAFQISLFESAWVEHPVPLGNLKENPQWLGLGAVLTPRTRLWGREKCPDHVTQNRQSEGCVLSSFRCPTLCDPMDCNLPGSSVPGILQARILGWVAMPPPGDFPDSGIKLVSLASPMLVSRFFYTGVTCEDHSWTCVYSIPISTSH